MYENCGHIIFNHYGYFPIYSFFSLCAIKIVPIYSVTAQPSITNSVNNKHSHLILFIMYFLSFSHYFDQIICRKCRFYATNKIKRKWKCNTDFTNAFLLIIGRLFSIYSCAWVWVSESLFAYLYFVHMRCICFQISMWCRPITNYLQWMASIFHFEYRISYLAQFSLSLFNSFQSHC